MHILRRGRMATDAAAHAHHPRARRILLFGVPALLVLGWALLPAARAVSLLANPGAHHAPDTRQAAGLPVREVHFTASDGVALAGWLALASPSSPTIILVHGFKANRGQMVPWAQYLFAAGYNVLLYDSRGCGESAGWAIGLGTNGAADVVGAVRYLQHLPDLRVRRFAALGVSLGAGDVVLAAAQEPALSAVIADSVWADERPLLDRMTSYSLGPLTVPLLPYEPGVVNVLLGTRLEAAQPVAAAAHLAPAALMVITSAHDANPTTSPADQQRLFDAASQPKVHWVAPQGGHAGALEENTGGYEARTLAFLGQYVGPPTPPR